MTMIPEGAPTLSQVLASLSILERHLVGGLTLALSEESATLDEWRILHLVGALGSPTMGELADASGMPNASLSRVVDSLEDAASVFRLPKPEDRRRISVQLSDHGRQRLARMDTIVSAWESSTRELIGGATVDDLAAAALRAGERIRPYRGQPV